MKWEFDIDKYRQLPEIYTEKRKYINECICKAGKTGQVIGELEFINLQIREFCGGYIVRNDIPISRAIGAADAAIINYVLQEIGDYRNRKLLESETGNQENKEYTVKSIILAYFYMRKKEIYPIPELAKATYKAGVVYEKLAAEYGLSKNSFSNDWGPIFKDRNKRLSSPDNIKMAIKIIKKFNYPNIYEAVELAREELNASELKT